MLRKLRIVSCLLLLITFCGQILPARYVQAQQGGLVKRYSDDFENQPEGPINRGTGWSIQTIDGSRVLAGQLASIFSLTGYESEDFLLRFKIKLEEGSKLSVWFNSDDGNRYEVLIQWDGLNAEKVGADGTKTHLVDGANRDTEWWDVDLEVNDRYLALSLNHQLALDYFSDDMLAPGTITLEIVQGGQVWIDNLELWGTPAQTEGGLKWVRTGGPIGGLGYDIRVNPSQPETMYVTDAYAGIFISTDGGDTWTNNSQGINIRGGESGDVIPVFSVSVDPNQNNTLWLGTQSQLGIFRSDDGGASWVRKDRGVIEQGITFRGFSVQPGNSDIVYAAGEIPRWEYEPHFDPTKGSENDASMAKGAVYKTVDGGENWQRVWIGDSLARYIWINPLDPRIVYVSTGIFDRLPANFTPENPGGEGVLKSVDGGETWRHANNGLDDLFVGSLFMHPSNPDILLAGTGIPNYSKKPGVYITQDGGETWQQTLESPVISAVEFALSDPSIAYAASYSGVWRSEDGGFTWTVVSGGDRSWGPEGIYAGTPIDIQVDPNNPDRLFINNYGGGNIRSDDGGKTWTIASTGYTGALVHDLAVSPTEPGRVTAAARSGLFLSNDGGENWTGLAVDPVKATDWSSVAIDPSNSHHIVSELTCNQISVRSQDLGSSWDIIYQTKSRVGWKVIKFSPSDPQTIYAGTGGYLSCSTFDSDRPAAGMLVSRDGGKTWYSSMSAEFFNAGVNGLAVHPNEPQTVVAATSNHGLLVTHDYGKTWAQIGTGLPEGIPVEAIAQDPIRPDWMYASVTRGGVYRSRDGGHNWSPAMVGLIPEGSYNDIVVDPANSDVLYVADRSSGVYRSQNGGDDWEVINYGLLNRAVTQLDISADGKHLYAATWGDGIYRLDLDGIPPQPAASPQSIQAESTNTPSLATLPPAQTPTLEQVEAQNDPGEVPSQPIGGPCASMALPVVVGAVAYLRQKQREGWA